MYIIYLSNSVNDNMHDCVWREFWFSNIMHSKALPIWRSKSNGVYVVNDAPSLIMNPKGELKMFFVGRIDSIKNKLCKKLNEKQISEDEAVKEYVINVRNRAHSYREDIDSGLEGLGLLESDGKPSDLGL